MTEELILGVAEYGARGSVLGAFTEPQAPMVFT